MERWLLAALVIAALIAFGIWWDRYRKRAREQSHIDSLGTSFARLKANPVRLEAIRGTIRKVCVITEEIDHGRRRGTATSYVSFMVTNNDEIVDLQTWLSRRTPAGWRSSSTYPSSSANTPH
jgi:hypothetical protein